MLGNDRDAFVHLDQFWDETARGNARQPAALDPELAGAIRRLHRLNDAVVPDAAFARRLWTDLSHEATSTMNRGSLVAPRSHALDNSSALSLVIPSRREESAGPNAQRQIPPAVGMTRGNGRNDGGKVRVPWSGWRRGLAGLVTVTVFVLTIAAGYAAFRLQPPASNPRLSAVSDPGSEALYAYVFDESAETATEPGRWKLTPLHPVTLADQLTDGAEMAKQPAWSGTLAARWPSHLWTLSGDGSTYVVVETWAYVNGVRAEGATIGVYDAQAGAERRRFDLPAAVRDIRLSRDGSRLVAQAHPNTPQVRDVGTLDPPEWFVVDTTDGHVMATIASDEKNGWHDDAWIDPEARRLYRLFIPHSQENTGPGATRIVADDLTTGEEVGRIELPEVQSGVWWTDRTHTVTGGVEYPVIAELRPGVALSPDGKTLAIVHADEDAVTTVDAERLVVERTEALTRPTGWGDRLLGLLLPEDAAAKAPGEGTDLQAVFAADGRHLYVFGFETVYDEDGANSRSLGLRLIDLETAEIVADELAGGFFTDVIPSPNGQDLYVIGSQPPDVMWSEDVPTRLWRLDAATLEVLTTRDFTETPRIMLSPALPDGRGQMPPGAG